MQVKSKKKYTQEFKDQIVALIELGKLETTQPKHR
jgi:transposase-like protein